MEERGRCREERKHGVREERGRKWREKEKEEKGKIMLHCYVYELHMSNKKKAL